VWRVTALIVGFNRSSSTTNAVRAALVRLDEMSDSELRDLVGGEPPMIVAAAEGIIGRRQSGE
jgi:hypothetical protein